MIKPTPTMHRHWSIAKAPPTRRDRFRNKWDAETSVGPSMNELVVLFESDSSPPILSQVPAGPQSDSDADPGEYYARNSKSVGSMENAMTKNADLRCVAEEQGEATNFQKKDAVT